VAASALARRVLPRGVEIHTGRGTVTVMPIGIDTVAYQRDLPHLSRRGKTYFITFNTYRLRELSDVERDIAMKCIVHDHLLTYALYAAVIMPEHVHMLITPIEDERRIMLPLQDIMERVKSASAHQIKKTCGWNRTWQHESFDHITRSTESVRAKAEYIVMNPVRRGLVEQPDDWPWIWRYWVEGENTASEGARRHTLPA